MGFSELVKQIGLGILLLFLYFGLPFFAMKHIGFSSQDILEVVIATIIIVSFFILLKILERKFKWGLFDSI